MRRYICDLCDEIIEDETDMFKMKIKDSGYDTFYTKYHVHGDCLRNLCKELKNARNEKLKEVGEKIKKLNEQLARFEKIAHDLDLQEDKEGGADA